jgi:PKD repeat protein
MKRLLLLLALCFLLCGVSSGGIIDHRFDLKLLLHGNLEPPTYSTSIVKDTSRYFTDPYIRLNASEPVSKVNINTTQIKYGNASMYFLGTKINVTLADSDSYTFGTNNHSVCAWFRWPNAAQEIKLFYHYQDANNYDLYSIASSSNIRVDRVRGGVSIGTASNTPVMYSGLWNQVCFIQNNSVTTMYLNGTAQATTVALSASQTDLTGTVRVGESGGGGLPEYHIDELSVFNGGFAPTIDELQGEYPMYLNGTYGWYADDNYTVSLLHFDGANGGTFFKDQYGNRTWTGAAVTTNTSLYKFGPSSGWFGTVGNRLVSTYTPAFDMGVGDWTIDGWLINSSVPNSIGGIVAAKGVTTNGYAIDIYPTGALTVVKNTTFLLTSPAGSIPANTANHFAVERYGNSLYIYVNGLLVATTSINPTEAFNSYGNVPIIGSALSDDYSYFYNGGIDEFRVTKGLARWTSNFTPPTTPYELITNQTWTPTPDASGTVPATIQFTDSTPSTAWTGNNYSWTFGDDGTSVLQSPSHVYSTSALFSATGNVFNNNMTSSLTKTIPIGAPDVDFMGSPLTGTAALQVTFTDLTTNSSPITSYLMDFGDGTTSTTVGPWTHVYSTFGAYSVNLTETNSVGTGFNYKRDYIVTSTQQGKYNTYYTPREVRIRIEDYFSNPIPGTTVNVSVVGSSLPNTSVSWIISAFGVDSTVAAEMISGGTVMNASTDSNGGLSFMMFKELEYNLAITNTTAGISSAKKLYPSDTEYVIHVALPGQAPGNNTLLQMNGTGLPVYMLNSSCYNLSMKYVDTSGLTTNVRFQVISRANGTYLLNKDEGNPGTIMIADNYTACKYQGFSTGDEILWMFNATRTGI